MFCSVWQDRDRYINGYFNVFNNKNIYFSGDGAFYDKEGYIYITGRLDDVMNVSGHRVSSSEIESAISKHATVSEAAVVSRNDEISGESLVAYIVIRDDKIKNDSDLLVEINAIISKEIGPIIKLGLLIIVPGLPKTRSGKVLRRILRSIARKELSEQDLSTIENPSIVNQIKKIASNVL